MKRKQVFKNSRGGLITFFGSLEAGAACLGADNLIFVFITAKDNKA